MSKPVALSSSTGMSPAACERNRKDPGRASYQGPGRGTQAAVAARACKALDVAPLPTSSGVASATRASKERAEARASLMLDPRSTAM